MRIINDIIIHCTDNKPGCKMSMKDFTLEFQRKYKTRYCGYHYVIFEDGRVEPGMPISRIGIHCKRHNTHSVGIAYVGGRSSTGLPADTRTYDQKRAMLKLVTNLIKLYRCDVHGHRDYTDLKECPCFDAHQEYTNIYRREVGLPLET